MPSVAGLLTAIAGVGCGVTASDSAIRLILAPIFVPMFMLLLGFHSNFARILFRIADSSAIPLFLGFLQHYQPQTRLGTYNSLILPYPLILLEGWLLMLVAWYVVSLPIGPGIYPNWH